MPIYTRRGDEGKTSTFGGAISKGDLLAEALGSIDELNSWIGLIRFKIQDSRLNGLKNIQRNLMDITSCLAGSKKRLRAGETKKLERMIDKLTAELPVLKNFVYPVGEIQVARAVARRCERAVVKFVNNAPSGPPLNLRGGRGSYVLKYLNRLSDALFTIARFVNHQNKIAEEIW